jgi:hypothetical protein
VFSALKTERKNQMDILFRLETVIETTLDGHPDATILFEYQEAAKEIRSLRQQLADAAAKINQLEQPSIY